MASVRANWSQFALRCIKRRSGPERDRLLDALPELRSELRDAGLLGWVTPETHMTLCEVLHRELGQQGALLFWRDYYLYAFDLSLLSPLVAGARRVFGDDPHSYLRQAPHVYSLVTRDAGSLSVERVDPFRARVQAKQLPPAFRRSPALVESLAGTCLACVRHARENDATLERDYEGLADGAAAFDVTWT